MARLGSLRTLIVLVLAVVMSLLILVGCGDRFGEAAALEKKGNLEGAVAIYREILTESPHDVQALTGLSVDLFQLQKWGEALAIEQTLAALDPMDAQIRVELGFNYLNHQGQPGKAVEVFGEAATLEPSARHLTYLAQAQIASGDTGTAETTLGKAIELEKGYGHAYGVLLALLEKQGRVLDAEAVRQAAAGAGATIPSGQSG